MRALFAWLAHLYTAMGFVCAAGIAVLIVHGGDASFRSAFFLMMIATAIDATDGWLARKADVENVLPGFAARASIVRTTVLVAGSTTTMRSLLVSKTKT